MGIGRREFLRLFGAGIAASSASPSAAIAILDDQYINRRLGIAFQKPKGWVFANVKQMADLKAGQILDLDDPDFAQAIIDSAELPILTISKEPLSTAPSRFTPGVTIYLERLSAEDRSAEELRPIQSAELDAESCQAMLKDFQVTSAATAVRVSDCDAAQYEASFIFEHQDLRPTPVRMRSLAIDQGVAFYTLRMYDSPILGGSMVVDYTRFIGSVKLV